MESLQIRGIGEAIRSVRKSRGLRLEDVADDQISTATISNIERGVGHGEHFQGVLFTGKNGIKYGSDPLDPYGAGGSVQRTGI